MSSPEEVSSSRFVNAELKIAGGLNKRFFELLAAIESTGSISQASRRVGMSYKGAWDLLDRANTISRFSLIAREIGGRQGGGARLTQLGRDLLDFYNQVSREHREFLERMNARLRNNDLFLSFYKGLSLQVSSSNRLFGRVERMRVGYVDVEIDLAIAGGHSISVLVTQASAEALKLRPGMEVVALLDAAQIILVKDFAGYRLSAGNQLSGVVERIERDEIDAMVILRLLHGDDIVAIISSESLQTMGLKVGDAVVAVFDPEAIALSLNEFSACARAAQG